MRGRVVSRRSLACVATGQGYAAGAGNRNQRCNRLSMLPVDAAMTRCGVSVSIGTDPRGGWTPSAEGRDRWKGKPQPI